MYFKRELKPFVDGAGDRVIYKIMKRSLSWKWKIHFVELEQFEEKLRANLKEKNEIFTKIYGIEPLDFDTIFEEYKGYIEQIKT